MIPSCLTQKIERRIAAHRHTGPHKFVGRLLTFSGLNGLDTDSAYRKLSTLRYGDAARVTSVVLSRPRNSLVLTKRITALGLSFPG